MMLRRFATSAALFGAVMTATPAFAVDQVPQASTAQASFYELTENMRLVGRGKPRRIAQSALVGTAQVGSPMCPTALVQAVSPGAAFCTITAVGEDDVNLATGLGPFDAKLTVVVQGDNPVDPPEFVVAKMRVSGKMDFSPAIVGVSTGTGNVKLPYGTVKGRLHVIGSDADPVPFVGVFRLPFLGSGGGRAACPLTPNANPNLPQDLVYVDSGPTGALDGMCLDIQPNELSLGWPAVRFDLWFQ